MVLVGAFDDALGGAREAAGICWQARYARLGRYCTVLDTMRGSG